MLHLSNDELRVEILDPVADQSRFGVRYCTGGYIFQVTDRRRGPLLSGPTFPDSFNWFDGQGIPDAFNLGPLISPNEPGRALIIGIGECDLRERRVIEFCDWSVQVETRSATFQTHQSGAGRAFDLVRTVRLAGRTVRSLTTITNTGRGEVPVRWFPHPFYPQPTGDELVWLNVPLRWQDGVGYRRLDNGFIARENGPWAEGRYLPLDHDAQAPLVLVQRHPTLGLVSAATSYIPAFFPLWGNAITFSWEPFFERTVAPGQRAAWWVDYTF
ncbi:MAG: hypothetical protein ACO3Z6_04575 [Pseudomonadales bacterium]